MSPKGSVEADVKHQASVRKQVKPAEPKEPKYHFWNAPKVTRDPRMTRLRQQGFLPVPPPPNCYSPEQARNPFDPPPLYSPPGPARPSQGLSDEGRSRREDRSQRGSEHDSGQRDQHGSQKESRR